MMKLRRAFTLIELLVVVAIIVILIAVLMPSLSNARNQARAVKCGSNLKQIGQAIYMYAQEYEGTVPIWNVNSAQPTSSRPPAATPQDPRADWEQCLWMVRLFPYLNIQPMTWATPTPTALNKMYGGVFTCPAKMDLNLTKGSQDGFAISYAINGFCFDDNDKLRPSDTGATGGTYFWYQKLIMIDPRSVMVSDIHLVRNNDPANMHADAVPVIRTSSYLYGANFLPLYHSYGHNMLFPGGDVQRVPLQGVSWSLKLQK